jgi:hypothetical protein
MRKLLTFLILATGLAFGQGVQRTPTAQAVENYLGNLKVLSGATVTVCPSSGSLNNCTPGTVHLYRDVGLSIPMTNPLHADANGNYTYYISPGTYGERVCSPGVTCTFNIITLGVSGAPTGTCENVGGATAGSVCYFDGTTWLPFPGNTSGDKFFHENSSGVPSWDLSTADYQHNEADVANQPALDFDDGGGVTFSLTNDSANGRVKVSAAVVSGGSVSFDKFVPLDTTGCDYPGTCSHLHRTGIPVSTSSFYGGPKTFTPQGAFLFNTTSSYDNTGTSGTATCTLPQAIYPGDVVVYQVWARDFSTLMSPATDTYLSHFNVLENGGGAGLSTQIGYAEGVNLSPYSPTPDTISVTMNANQNWTMICGEVGAVPPSGALDVFTSSAGVCSAGSISMPATTTGAADLLVGFIRENNEDPIYVGTGGSYVNEQIFNGASGTSRLNAAILSQFKSTPGTYPMTASSTPSCSGGDGPVLGFKYDSSLRWGLPSFDYIYYPDLTIKAGFPILTGNAGKPLVANATETGFVFGSFPASGVSSIQPENNGTPYGSAQTGAITMNFANCTVSSTFTITCPSGGSSVSINSTGEASPNFNDTTPTAESGYQNIKWQLASHNVSAEVPLAGSSVFGVMKPDNSTISCTAGVCSASNPGSVTITLDTSGTGTLSTTYTYNQQASATATASYTLPTASAGAIYCVGNSYNGSAMDTGAITVTTSAVGQYIIYGAISITNGFVVSGGAAGDDGCLVGLNTTTWQFYPKAGTWTLD